MSARHRLFFVMIMSALLALAPAAYAQVTTGTLTGAVIIQGDGSALPGATIDATHVPTGTRYLSVTADNGRYVIPNVRVGGPYRINASLDGFRPEQLGAIEVGLGTATEVPEIALRPEVTETITVTATADDIINPNRTGSSSAVSEEQIETLPTVNRSLQDFARTNPYFNVDPGDATATRVTVAGRNNRYNSIQIDGAVNNDLFGLADTGTPGGQTDSQPISLDAVKQIQLVVSPYDVRQGGFTGGGINAVTRSGSNAFEGSVFGSQRDEQYVGDGPFNTPIGAFESTQYGGRLGGRILEDRLFFFINGETNLREESTGVAADGSAGTVFNQSADAARLRDFLISQYSYDPGTLGDIPDERGNDLIFGRLDWNVNPSNQLTLRHNYVDAVRDVIANRSSTPFRFPTAIYTIADKTNSTVAQLNSVFNASVFNEARIGFQTIRDVRATPVIFPTVEIGGTGPRNGALHVGTERFSGANALDQDILEVTDDLTLLRGNHSITLGTHNEFFKFKNLFLSEAYGYYYFPTVAAFEAGTPLEYRISFANGSDPRRPTQFEVGQYGIYATDQWRVNNSLSLTIGLRADLPRFGDRPSRNPAIESAIGFSTAETASESVVVSPRVGFNWQIGGAGTQQLRGGIGIFAGRTPYVWISNAYGNTGIESTALGCTGSCQRPLFNPDPLTQPRNLGSSGATVSVDLIDPDFELPRILRATLGYDRELFFGIKGTAEVLWSQTQKDVFYYNVNKKEVGTSPLDGRPTYAGVSSTIGDAILLDNTSEGDDTTATLQFNRPFSNGLTLAAAYAYQEANSAFAATSSRAISNWQFRHTKGDIFKDDVSRSPFEVENRFNVSASYRFETGFLGHVVGLYYNTESGRPYSLLMSGDPNRDGYSSNDALYVPAAEDAIILQNSSRAVIPYTRLADYLKRAGIDPTAGRILDPYELNGPWARQLDLHYELGVPLGGVRTALTFDILNLLNMFDSEAGVVRFVSFQAATPIFYAGQDTATGKPIYREAFNGALNPGRQFSTATDRSRWQGRLGLRVSF